MHERTTINRKPANKSKHFKDHDNQAPLAPAVCFLRRSVHGPFDQLTAAFAAPVVLPVVVDLVVHGVPYGYVVSARRALRAAVRMVHASSVKKSNRMPYGKRNSSMGTAQ